MAGHTIPNRRSAASRAPLPGNVSRKATADQVEELNNRGAALFAAQRPDEAIAAWEHASRLDPDHLGCIVALGGALIKAGRAEAALPGLTKAAKRHPGDVPVLTTTAQALVACGRTEAAIGVLFMALDAAPESWVIHASLAQTLFNVDDLQPALHHGLAAFHIEQNHANAITLSGILVALGRFDDALAFNAQALAERPDCEAALGNRALALQGLGCLDEAVVAARQAVIASRDAPAVRRHLAHILLSMGQMEEGWAEYEARLSIPKAVPPWFAAAPQWQGQDITGRTILLHTEQGLGDMLQFVRYVPLVAARAGRVILVVQQPLVRLLQVTPGATQVIAAGDPLPPFDVACMVMSLPHRFGTTLDNVPPALPYAGLFAPPAGDREASLRVGLVWAGNGAFRSDRHRSISKAALAALVGIPGIQFFSLQHQAPEAAEEFGVIELMTGVQDFADTAALVAGLDLVISVDTSVAHLAATMGKPVWLLSRQQGCWRWLHDRADSPWYPTLRILRQTTPDDWGEMIDQLRHDLTTLTSQVPFSVH
jgi:tetratricopeptide (TPR) repeat protein